MVLSVRFCVFVCSAVSHLCREELCVRAAAGVDCTHLVPIKPAVFSGLLKELADNVSTPDGYHTGFQGEVSPVSSHSPVKLPSSPRSA